MKSRSEVNKRIVKEIASLDVDEAMKEFLNSILSYELDVIDEARPRYTDEYLGMIDDAID